VQNRGHFGRSPSSCYRRSSRKSFGRERSCRPRSVRRSRSWSARVGAGRRLGVTCDLQNSRRRHPDPWSPRFCLTDHRSPRSEALGSARRPAGKEARRSCIRSDTASRSRRGQPGCRVDRRPVIRQTEPRGDPWDAPWRSRVAGDLA
jgi:hypothetical protein